VSYQGNNRLADSDWSSHGSRGGVHDALTWEYPEVQRRLCGSRAATHFGVSNRCAWSGIEQPLR
jgi:hypothetical protein